MVFFELEVTTEFFLQFYDVFFPVLFVKKLIQISKPKL